MRTEEAEIKEFARLIRHTLLVFAFLIVWGTTAWAIDKRLMVWFPLEGLSMVSFRLLELVLHVSTFRSVYHLVFKRSKPYRAQWWM